MHAHRDQEIVLDVIEPRRDEPRRQELHREDPSQDPQSWLKRQQRVHQTRLAKLNARLHILDGMLIAYLNLDEVIRIVRTEDEPKLKLIKRFKLSEEQAEEILETKLRRLAKLEEMKIRDEQKKLAEERDEIEKILKSKARLTKLVREDLLSDAEEFGA